MHKTNVAAMVEAGVMSAIVIVFAMISVYLPFMVLFINMVFPVPIILLGVRHGHKWSIMAVVASAIMIAILIEPVLAVKMVIGYSLVGIVLGHALRSKFSPAKTLLVGSLTTMVSIVALFGLMLMLMGVNLMNLQFQMMGEGMKQAIEIYRSYGMPEEKLIQMQEMSDKGLAVAKIAIPAAFLLGSVLASYINLAFARLVLRRLGLPTAGFGPFKHWAAPTYILWAAVAGGALVYLGQLQQVELITNLGINILLFSLICVFVHGLAVFYFLADKYNLSRLIRGIILLMIFLNAIFVLIVLYAGAFDMALDYRKLRSSRQS